MYKRLLSVILVFLIIIAVQPMNIVTATKQSENSELLTLVETLEIESTEISLNYSSAHDMLADMSLVCDNNMYALYLNKMNMTFAVVNKKTSEIFLSNPYDASTDPTCTGDNEKNVESQVIVSFYDSDYQKQNLWSSSDCLKFGQYKVEIYENGVLFKLSIGEEKGQQIVPIALNEEDYEKFIDKLDKKQARTLNAFYSLYEKGTFYNAEMLEKYPTLKNHRLYILEGEPSDRERGILSDIFIAAGYTYEKYTKDMASLEIDVEKILFPNFKLNLECILTESGLNVNIPNDSISASEGFQLLEISVLPYFGCDKPSIDGEGYLFVPDGSGALIDINNQVENRQTAIAGRVYGENPVTDKQNELNDSATYHLPVYGIRRNNKSSLVAITTSGEVADYIVALLGGPNGNYFTVYNRFIYTEFESSYTQPKIVSNGSVTGIYIKDDNRYTCDYSISYTFLSVDDGNYVGMANVYRQYLSKKMSNKSSNIEDAQIAVRTIGSALIEKDFLGFPYKSEVVFTRYEDNINIIEDLKEVGFKDISVSLDGWEKNGLDASISNKIRLSPKLGGNGGFLEFTNFCKKKDIFFTLTNEFVFTKYNRWFDDFSVKSSAAQTLELSVVEYLEHRSFPELKDRILYVTSPVRYKKYLSNLEKSAIRNKVYNISLDSIGKYLVADFSERHSINRQQTLEEITKNLSNIQTDFTLTFDGANAYVIPYAYQLEDIPCNSSGLAGITESVPFLQLAVSGYVRMNSKPINLTGDMQVGLLDCIRCDVVPTYMVAKNNLEQLKKTDYSTYFAIDYNYISKDIENTFKQMEEALSIVSKCRLVDYYCIEFGVYCSVYDNGCMIYTNYTDSDYNSGNIIVEAYGFSVNVL